MLCIYAALICGIVWNLYNRNVTNTNFKGSWWSSARSVENLKVTKVWPSETSGIRVFGLRKASRREATPHQAVLFGAYKGPFRPHHMTLDLQPCIYRTSVSCTLEDIGRKHSQAIVLVHIGTWHTPIEMHWAIKLLWAWLHDGETIQRAHRIWT